MTEVQLGEGNNKVWERQDMGMSLKRMRGMDEDRGRYNMKAKGCQGANTAWDSALQYIW